MSIVPSKPKEGGSIRVEGRFEGFNSIENVSHDILDNTIRVIIDLRLTPCIGLTNIPHQESFSVDIDPLPVGEYILAIFHRDKLFGGIQTEPKELQSLPLSVSEVGEIFPIPVINKVGINLLTVILILLAMFNRKKIIF